MVSNCLKKLLLMGFGMQKQITAEEKTKILNLLAKVETLLVNGTG
jgi:hypothetical protein